MSMRVMMMDMVMSTVVVQLVDITMDGVLRVVDVEVDDFPMVVRSNVQKWISEVQTDLGSNEVEDHLHEIWEISNRTVLDQMDQGISVQDILTIDQVLGYKIMDLRVLP